MPKLYPTEHKIRVSLVSRVDEFIRITGSNKSKIGLGAVKDPAAISRIAAGGNFTIGTYGRIQKYLDRRWPRGWRK